MAEDSSTATKWDLSQYLMALLKGSSALPSFTPAELVVRPPRAPSSGMPAPPPARQRKRVVVIGAGLAGLAAAIELAKMDFDVVVVEARDRVGGRVQTKDGVDLGAGWIHGIEDNPLSGLCSQAGLSLLNTGESVTMLEANGAAVPTDVDDRMLGVHQQLLREAKEHGLALAQQEANAEALRKQQASEAADKSVITPEDLAVVGRCFADGADLFTVHQVVWSPAHGLKVAWYFDAARGNAQASDECAERSYHYSTLAEVTDWVHAYDASQARALVHGYTRPTNKAAVTASSANTSGSDGSTGAPLRDEHGSSLGLGEVMQELVSKHQATVVSKRVTTAVSDSFASTGTSDALAPTTAVAGEGEAASHDANIATDEVLVDAPVSGMYAAVAAEDTFSNTAAKNPQVWNDMELRLLRWHEQNVSLATGGAPFGDLSLRHWDHDLPWAFEGAHCLVKEGYGALVEWLHAQAPPSCVQLKWAVGAVEFGWKMVTCKLPVMPDIGLGISIEEDTRGNGLMVKSVALAASARTQPQGGCRPSRSASSTIALASGDVLSSINNHDCSNMTLDDAVALVRRASPGDHITFKALRKTPSSTQAGAAANTTANSSSSTSSSSSSPHNGRKCRVVDQNRERVLWADAVLVTLPLGVLKTGDVKFDPPLPEAKQHAIDRLGVGQLEKVVLRFSVNFWSEKTAGADGNMFFGRLPKEKSSDGDEDDDEDESHRPFFWFLDLSGAVGAPCLAALLPAEVQLMNEANKSTSEK